MCRTSLSGYSQSLPTYLSTISPPQKKDDIKEQFIFRESRENCAAGARHEDYEVGLESELEFLKSHGGEALRSRVM
jgi:hypothetical protein